MKIRISYIILFLILLSVNILPQKKPLDLGMLGEPLKDFSLPAFNGGEFNLLDEKGKNNLLVFPRGYYDKDFWCDICAYEYFDFVDEFYNQRHAEKYNLDLVFILPYDTSTIRKWLDDLPEVYAGLEAGKHLADGSTCRFCAVRCAHIILHLEGRRVSSITYARIKPVSRAGFAARV